jgi:hypothetical protein
MIRWFWRPQTVRTKKQRLASKLNGQKSRGPVTAEGKARSARNAIKHGVHAKAVVLGSESQEKYREVQVEYYEFWQPDSLPERDLVNDIVSARWRLNRLVAMETAATDAEMDQQRESLDKDYSRLDVCTRAALAYSALVEDRETLVAMNRAEARYHRTIQRATEQLLALKTQNLENKPERAQLPPNLQPAADLDILKPAA